MSEKLDDGIEERVPYGPRSYFVVLPDCMKSSFFPTSANFYNGVFWQQFSLFGCTALRIALLLPACSGYNILKCAFMLHADFACGKTSYDSPLPCEHYFFLFKSKHASVEQVETFRIAVST